MSDCMSWLGVDPHKRLPLPVSFPTKIKGKPMKHTYESPIPPVPQPYLHPFPPHHNHVPAAVPAIKFFAMNHNAPTASCPFCVSFLVKGPGGLVSLLLLLLLAARPPMLVARMRGYEDGPPAAAVVETDDMSVRGRRRSGREDGGAVVAEVVVLAFILACVCVVVLAA